MAKLLVIGCGGVAQVAIQKCCQNDGLFTELVLASRTKAKCDALKEKLAGKTKTVISTAEVDADNVAALCVLIRDVRPDAVLNLALPYQDLSVMEACLECGVDYIDTANYEPENTDDPAWREIYEKRCKELGFSAYFDYSWQWAYDERFRFGILDRIFPQAIQQVKCILRVLRHVVSQLILCEIVESHQLCLFQTKSKHLFQHFLVVIGIATVTQAGICLIDILSQLTVLSILE